MRTLIAVLFLATSVWAQTAQQPSKGIPEQGSPPRNLKVRPDGHVSANQDPPNPEKFEVHIVRRGETLWLIAGEVLKNPRLWPQLWEQNEHIINPHWIYPNDQILIKPVTVLSEAKPPETPAEPQQPAAAEPEQPQTPRKVVYPAVTVIAPPEPAARSVFVLDQQKPTSEVKYHDLYCSGMVRTAPIPDALHILSKFQGSGAVLATDAEYVYLSQGAEDGITVGTVFQVVRPTKELTNPFARRKTERDLGLHFLDIGQLRVVLVQPDFSLARVIHSCADAVDAGDILMPFQPIVLPPLPRPRPFSPTMTAAGGVKGMIVSTKDVMLNFGSSFDVPHDIPGVPGGHLGPMERGIAGAGAIVYIDIGQNHSVCPGDLFIVYRDVEIDERLYALPYDVKKIRNTRSAIGELVVLKVGERAATALVTYASDGLALGDLIESR